MIRFFMMISLVLCGDFCLAEGIPEDTNDIKSLNYEQAEDVVVVAEYRAGKDLITEGVLSLNGLDSIDEGVASSLASFDGPTLLLSGLTSIDQMTASRLAVHGVVPDYRLLNQQNFHEKHATLSQAEIRQHEILKEFRQKTGVANERYLDLSGLISIDKHVARALARYSGTLCLDGLASIDEETAEEFKFFEGETLSIGLTSMNEAVAGKVIFWKPRLIVFPNLTSIDKNVAKELRSYRSWQTEMKGLGILFSGEMEIDEITHAYLKSNPLITVGVNDIPQKVSN